MAKARENKAEQGPIDKAPGRAAAAAQARRHRIAGAVIDILALEGARGLTHRRIDSHLGLPEGATSYHFPRRFDLLEAGFIRLFEDGVEEFRRCYRPVLERLEAGDALDVELAAACAFKHWKLLTRPASRDQIIARLEFYLLATHDPNLRAVQQDRRKDHFDLTTQIFTELGCRNPKRASGEFSARVQSDYVTRFIAPPFEERPRTEAYFATLIRQIIEESDSTRGDREIPVDRVLLLAT
ncbi:MAG: hypothetical protein JNJ73_10150 [Hyphomonadaceae bacterium]|nr:hypothetical protein [Hyphomonadaceae bacterium]